MSSKHAKSSYNLRSRRGEAEHVSTAAERVFNTPYVARQIVQWAGLSGVNARLVAPGIPRLERVDPAFRSETKRMLDALSPKIIQPKAWWDALRINYEDTAGRVRRSELFKSHTNENSTARTREEKLSECLHVTVFDERGKVTFYATSNTDSDEIAGVKHSVKDNGDVVTFTAPNPDSEWVLTDTSPGPYIRKNQSLRPDLWLPMIRFDTHPTEDGTLTFDEL